MRCRKWSKANLIGSRNLLRLQTWNFENPELVVEKIFSIFLSSYSWSFFFVLGKRLANSKQMEWMFGWMQWGECRDYLAHSFHCTHSEIHLQEFDETSNHWFRSNPIRSPSHLIQAGNRGAVQAGDKILGRQNWPHTVEVWRKREGNIQLTGPCQVDGWSSPMRREWYQVWIAWSLWPLSAGNQSVPVTEWYLSKRLAQNL